MSADAAQSAAPTLTLTIANSALARRPSGDRRATLDDPFATKEKAETFLAAIAADATRRRRPRFAASRDVLARLADWRAALRGLLDALAAGVEPPPECLSVVNAAAERAMRSKLLTSVMAVEETVSADDPVAWLSALCVDELSRCDPRRVKICARPQCGMVFYDQTRNGAARWHAEDPCGWRSRDEKRRGVAAPR